MKGGKATQRTPAAGGVKRKAPAGLDSAQAPKKSKKAQEPKLDEDDEIEAFGEDADMDLPSDLEEAAKEIDAADAESSEDESEDSDDEPAGETLGFQFDEGEEKAAVASAAKKAAALQKSGMKHSATGASKAASDPLPEPSMTIQAQLEQRIGQFSKQFLDEDEKKKKKQKDNSSVVVKETVDGKVKEEALKKQEEFRKQLIDPEEEEERKKREEFFGETPELVDASTMTFEEMGLSKPLIKVLTSKEGGFGFQKPTSVQANAIPIILAGKDICASAMTGSGKTLAFLVPSVERIIRGGMGRKRGAARCLVLTPTRELAAQCAEVMQTLLPKTKMTHALCVGGEPIAEQEAVLAHGVDFLVATPGRLLDHLINSRNVSLDGVEILVLDEADSLLDLGFKSQLEEIIRACPKGRQSLLFSATMTDEVERLAELSLNRPVRLSVDKKYDMNSGLSQEFIRMPPFAGNAIDTVRDAVVLYICHSVLTARAMIFCATREAAHRVMLLLKLTGLKANELHGALDQQARVDALAAFRKGEVDFVVTTDLSARGLDIEGARNVVNHSLPRTITRYVHRVGRTARAGRTGRSVSITSEGDSTLLADIIKHTMGKVVKRKLDEVQYAKWLKELTSGKLGKEMGEITKIEAQDAEMGQAEMEATKASNMLTYGKDIMSRPRRQWLQEDDSKSGKKRKRDDADGDEEDEPKSKRSKKEDPDKKDKRKRDAQKNQRKSKEKGEMAEARRGAKAAKRGIRRGEASGKDKAKSRRAKETEKKKRAKRDMRKSAQEASESAPRETRIKSARKTKGTHAFKSKQRHKRR